MGSILERLEEQFSPLNSPTASHLQMGERNPQKRSHVSEITALPEAGLRPGSVSPKVSNVHGCVGVGRGDYGMA